MQAGELTEVLQFTAVDHLEFTFFLMNVSHKIYCSISFRGGSEGHVREEKVSVLQEMLVSEFPQDPG